MSLKHCIFRRNASKIVEKHCIKGMLKKDLVLSYVSLSRINIVFGMIHFLKYRQCYLVEGSVCSSSMYGKRNELHFLVAI